MVDNDIIRSDSSSGKKRIETHVHLIVLIPNLPTPRETHSTKSPTVSDDEDGMTSARVFFALERNCREGLKFVKRVTRRKHSFVLYKI